MCAVPAVVCVQLVYIFWSVVCMCLVCACEYKICAFEVNLKGVVLP